MTKLQRVVIVGGCGHVGLPLGIVLASKAGLQVDLLDIDRAKIDLVNSGEMPFMERGADDLLRNVAGKSLQATADPTCIKGADAVITVVGTPVDRHLNPTVGDVYRSIDALLDHMQDGTLLVLRSTVYPGVTKLVHERLKRLNRKVLLAFCPERIAEGNAIEELIKLPQIVSGFDPEAIAAASR
ncbi:MAG: NAD(P)-binding domain-containing protein, partial [Candidatus Korobacteraceae bacterium]